MKKKGVKNNSKSKNVKIELDNNFVEKVKFREIKRDERVKTKELEKEIEEPQEFISESRNRRPLAPVLQRERARENLEQQVEQVPVTNKNVSNTTYVPNATSYNPNYGNVNYQSERREDIDKQMNVTLTPVRRRDELEFRRNEPRRINVGAWRDEFTGIKQEEKYIIQTRTEERDDSLPFEQRKRRRLI